MSSIQSFVTKNVCPDLEKNQKLSNEVAFDPTIIMAIIGVITMLISDCSVFKRKPEEIQNKIKKVGIFERWVLRQQVKNYIDDKHIFKLYGAQIVEALVNAGPKATVEDITAAIAEVRG